MDSINTADFISYYECVQHLISKHLKNSEVDLQKLVLDLLSTKLTKLPERESNDCRVQYKDSHLEFKMWNLALLSTSWIIGVFKQKSVDGHCHNMEHDHGEREPRKCSTGHEFHLQMYNECLKSFKDLLSMADENS
jgi:hypothetical protein